MSFKVIPPKLAKKDLLALYDITHPTLRAWFRRAGLEEFIGRRKFLARELVLIFQHIGKPRLARTAAQRLKDVYARFVGALPDEVRFRQKYKQELPKQRQDKLADSEEELDAPQVYHLEGRSDKDSIHIHDALSRLTATAIFLIGQKARKETEKRQLLIVKRRKRLGKRRFRARAA